MKELKIDKGEIVKRIITIIILIILDQIIKINIANTMNASITLIPHCLKITYLANDGAAFGILSSQILLIMINIIIITIITILLIRKDKELLKIQKMGMTLVISGGIGNLIDRLIRGYVIDYIDITELFDYPIFNFADILIVVGAIMIIVGLLMDTLKRQEMSNENI